MAILSIPFFFIFHILINPIISTFLVRFHTSFSNRRISKSLKRRRNSFSPSPVFAVRSRPFLLFAKLGQAVVSKSAFETTATYQHLSRLSVKGGSIFRAKGARKISTLSLDRNQRPAFPVCSNSPIRETKTT
jgi:hypothetical protein